MKIINISENIDLKLKQQNKKYYIRLEITEEKYKEIKKQLEKNKKK